MSIGSQFYNLILCLCLCKERCSGCICTNWGFLLYVQYRPIVNGIFWYLFAAICCNFWVYSFRTWLYISPSVIGGYIWILMLVLLDMRFSREFVECVSGLPSVRDCSSCVSKFLLYLWYSISYFCWKYDAGCGACHAGLPGHSNCCWPGSLSFMSFYNGMKLMCTQYFSRRS